MFGEHPEAELQLRRLPQTQTLQHGVAPSSTSLALQCWLVNEHLSALIMLMHMHAFRCCTNVSGSPARDSCCKKFTTNQLVVGSCVKFAATVPASKRLRTVRSLRQERSWRVSQPVHSSLADLIWQTRTSVAAFWLALSQHWKTSLP